MAIDQRQVEAARAAHNRHQDRLPMWTVYNKGTKDFPGRWVARMFVTLPLDRPTEVIIVADSIDEIREAIPPGLYRTPRDPEDDVVIEESWF